MPQLNTRYFGRLEFADDAMLHFPGGIPGFEEEKSFVLIEQPGTHPLVFMQSAASVELCFAALPVGTIVPQYRLRLESEESAQLALPAGQRPEIGKGLLCLALLTFGETECPSANLMAPIVVNLANRKAIQSIQSESGYSPQHPLTPERVEALC